MKRIFGAVCVVVVVLLLTAGMVFAGDGKIMPPMPNTPVRFYVQDNYDGTWDLQLTITNLSQYPWGAGQMDLICTKGLQYLANKNEAKVKIEESVARGASTLVTIPLSDYVKGGNMRFNVKYGDLYLMGFYIKF